MWTQKYRPRKLDEVLGNQKAVEMLRQYHWRRPLILHGAQGTGKSSLVEALARETGWDIVEISDENIPSAKTICETASIFGGRKLILIDNADEIRDIKEVAEIVKSTKNPMVLTTTDLKSKRLATVKKSCEEVQVRRMTSASIEKFLALILKKEGVEPDMEVVKKIAENANGDLRAAVNDLETAAKGGRIAGDFEVSARDSSIDIYKAMNAIFSKDARSALESMWDLNEQPRDVLLWIDENLPGVYGEKNVGGAMHYLSRADIFLGRIQTRQYWGFLRYANPLMSAGVNVSKPERVAFAPYRFPSYFAKMGWTKRERSLKQGIGEKLSPELHVSAKVAASEYIPLFRNLIKAGKIEPEEIARQFKLDAEEVDYLAAV
ncbi:MAG: hypothetical protein MSIBF_05205 [Candidatus Altiarchaeales archaeon IMC4]|nr:MAG: hypothetical protein MSIBF_05205 [Candidatus Altiarchaeales archaeon IMC4]